MSDQVKPRRRLGWTIIISLVIITAFSASLFSFLTGVYSCPAFAMLDGGSGYLVQRSGRWYVISINGNTGSHINLVIPEIASVEPGIWRVRMTQPDGWTTSAWVTFNFIDMWHLTNGRHAELWPSK